MNAVADRALERARGKARARAEECDRKAASAEESLPALEEQYDAVMAEEARAWKKYHACRKPELRPGLEAEWRKASDAWGRAGAHLRAAYKRITDNREEAAAMRDEESMEFMKILHREQSLVRLSSYANRKPGEERAREREWPPTLDKIEDPEEIIGFLRALAEPWGYQAIADALAERGYKTKRGGKWHSSSVRAIAKRLER